MFRAIANAIGHPAHFWGKWAGFFLCMAVGWWQGDVSFYMLLWTTLLTQTTDSQTIAIQYAGMKDTADIKAELKELARAMPGARDIIPSE